MRLATKSGEVEILGQRLTGSYVVRLNVDGVAYVAEVILRPGEHSFSSLRLLYTWTNHCDCTGNPDQTSPWFAWNSPRLVAIRSEILQFLASHLPPEEAHP